METKFYIVINIKSSKGFEGYGRFYIGNNREFAENVFNQLLGSDAVTEQNVLHLDFMEMVDELPVNIKMIRCTLSELAENCKIITKEVFKLFNLREL